MLLMLNGIESFNDDIIELERDFFTSKQRERSGVTDKAGWILIVCRSCTAFIQQWVARYKFVMNHELL